MLLNPVDAYVFDVFFAVVVGNRSPHALGISGEDAGHRCRGVACRPCRDLGDLDEAALAFDQDTESRSSLARFDTVTFPVPELLAMFNHRRPLKDRNTRWNMGVAMCMAMPLALPATMGPCKTADEVLLAANVRHVDVLVDRFVADPHAVVHLAQGPCNLFG